MSVDSFDNLLRRYDVPVPRYTSYPTVPQWKDDSLSPDTWQQAVRHAFGAGEQALSLYLHLPFCEQFCTYCACNKKITTNHRVEKPYMTALLLEWAMYKRLFDQPPVLHELHLGGGTPTFFSPANLEELLTHLTAGIRPAPEAEYSVEVHPNVTTVEHLEVLHRMGFRRLSVGIQDFDPEVQRIINRHQTYEQTRHIIEAARAIGFHAVNADLIYGLPRQTADSIRHTFTLLRSLRPDRIAFYSYAHVPWKSRMQRLYTEADLPDTLTKRRLYELGRHLLAEEGYGEIGMDHFALPDDRLWQAFQQGKLHRNFMGYTTQPNELLIGLGASAISDTGQAFVQNHREVSVYEQAIQNGEWPIARGHLLSREDQVLRRHIRNVICQGHTAWHSQTQQTPFLAETRQRLEVFQQEGFIELAGASLRLLPAGKPFLRNICTAFDAYYQPVTDTADKPRFSRAI